LQYDEQHQDKCRTEVESRAVVYEAAGDGGLCANLELTSVGVSSVR